MCPNQQVAISEQLPLYRILNQVVSELRLCWFRFLEKREVGLRVFPTPLAGPCFPGLMAADYWRLRSGPWPSGKLLVFST